MRQPAGSDDSQSQLAAAFPCPCQCAVALYLAVTVVFSTSLLVTFDHLIFHGARASGLGLSGLRRASSGRAAQACQALCQASLPKQTDLPFFFPVPTLSGRAPGPGLPSFQALLCPDRQTPNRLVPALSSWTFRGPCFVRLRQTSDVVVRARLDFPQTSDFAFEGPGSGWTSSAGFAGRASLSGPSGLSGALASGLGCACCFHFVSQALLQVRPSFRTRQPCLQSALAQAFRRLALLSGLQAFRTSGLTGLS